VALKIPNLLHQNFFHCDVDLPAISFHTALKWRYPLKVGELVVVAQCNLSLLESFSSLYVILS